MYVLFNTDCVLDHQFPNDLDSITGQRTRRKSNAWLFL